MIKDICNSFYSSPDEKKELAETIAARKAVSEFLFNHSELKGVCLELESLISASEVYSEYQGFYFGFKYAIELLEKNTNKKAP
jgi:hypothetical protein